MEIHIQIPDRIASAAPRGLLLAGLLLSTAVFGFSDSDYAWIKKDAVMSEENLKATFSAIAVGLANENTATAALGTTVANLQTQITALQSSVTSLQTDNGTLKSSNTTLQSQVAALTPQTPPGMVLIPSGTFWMGCNAAKDSNCNPAESPQHKVTLSSYFMDLTETTVGQYKACVDAGGCPNAPSSVQPAQYATYPGLTNNPVNFVTWTQAQQYCQWRGAGYDLPTEAQWEMAARGSCEKNGSTASDDAGCKVAMRTYPWGEAPADFCGGFYAVMNNGTNGCGSNSTWAVDSMKNGDSPYGLHDMAGNVWEWTRDWYSSTYYGSSPATDPYDSASASYRVFRGGCFNYGAVYLRAGYRDYGSPSDAGSSIGLRCMRSYP